MTPPCPALTVGTYTGIAFVLGCLVGWGWWAWQFGRGLKGIKPEASER